MLVASLMALEADKLDIRDQQQRRQHSSRHAVTGRQNAAKGQRQNVPSPPSPASGFSVEVFLVLACVAVSLIVLPLVLPPLPPPPPMVLLVPVCLLLLLAALATFVPSDMRSMTSS